MTRSPLGALLLLSIVSCGVRSLGAPSPRVTARARLLRIEDTRRDEPSYVDSLLADPDAIVRGLAALTAGRIGGIEHAPRLRLLAADADTGVAASALFSLGLLKDTASVTVASVSLRGPMAPAREAAWLLGEVGDRGRSAIEAGLLDESISPSSRGALLLAATRLRPVPASAIVPWLTSPDSALAWRAAYALARGRGTSGVRALLAQSNSQWPAVREQVARGASRGLAGDSLAPLAEQVVGSLVRDASAHVRVNAVRSLATYGPSTRSAMFAALADPDINVRVSAAQSLEPVVASDSNAWYTAFDGDTTFIVRRSLAEAAIKRGIDLPARARWGLSTDWQHRAVAAEVSGAGNAAAAMRRASAWLGDPDGRVRAVAVDALTPLADSAATRDDVRTQLRAALADTDVAVRANSMAALRRGASAADLAAALQSYHRFIGDADSDARLAFWRLADSAIVRTGGALPDSMRRELAALPRPLDPIERAVASAIPQFAAWRDGTSPSQPLLWYEQRAAEASARAPILRIETERGPMELELHASDAPLTVYNVVTLARRGYFDGQRFHRVVPNFVVQAGDPRGDGNGGPGYAIRDEINRH